MQCFNKLVPSRENDFQVIILGLAMVSFQDKIKYCPDGANCVAA